MRSFIKFIGKFLFFLLLAAHFVLIFLIFTPTPKLLHLWREELVIVEPEAIPPTLSQLEKERDLVATPDLAYENTFDRVITTILKWRRNKFMTDEEKLAFDLTTLDFGKGVVGMNSASVYYFKKPLTEISSNQWITLVNLNKIFRN